ncbi:MAG: 50S ribosomal protein L22 [Deltaproteobacteria bacterium]|nr:50S ribosomal protein L22 [Deltaproteobacteria bacterium]
MTTTKTETGTAPKKPKREKAKAIARKAARTDGPAIAHISGVRISARKVRVLADMVRGMKVDAALTTLAFQQRAGAPLVKKAIDSAVANADHRKMDLDQLIVADVQIDKAGILRRYLPRAHGRATPIRKQLSHIHVKLAVAGK